MCPVAGAAVLLVNQHASKTTELVTTFNETETVMLARRLYNVTPHVPAKGVRYSLFMRMTGFCVTRMAGGIEFIMIKRTQ
jgi:hypothetical protein